jgi:hypothetical protein
MRRFGFPQLFILFAITGSFGFCRLKGDKSSPVNGFAVVELFTSEGCSSCPPADAAVGRLLHDHPDRLYVLGFHVDYWDRLGWKDNFSSPVATVRQEQYGRFFQLGSVFTPQVVVNGTKQFVGSNEKELRATVDEYLAQTPSASLELSSHRQGQNIRVEYKTSAVSGALHLAVVQMHAVTRVVRGENAGRTLEHVSVVRDYKSVDLKDAVGYSLLVLPKDVGSGDCEIIGFVQGQDSKITAAAKAMIQ